ncbi:uncharacterized protein LOC105187232 [Harpegnathos saltator]|uniref:uncharacterized protein LOC105187232 n=1 Tax=Harpegnathos saltator TaxID=610380 RepID=UPI00058F0E7A|nr:uncharacterized protein LOC105187232 [Harpegnathos saltator]
MSFCVVFGCKNRCAKKNHEQLGNEVKNKKFSFHVYLKTYHTLRSLRRKLIWKTSKQQMMNFEKYNVTSSNVKHRAISIHNSYKIWNQQGSNNNNGKIESTASMTTKMDRSSSISPDCVFNSPTKTQLREFHAHEMKIMKRKLSISSYKNKQLQSKVIEAFVKGIAQEGSYNRRGQ